MRFLRKLPAVLLGLAFFTALVPRAVAADTKPAIPPLTLEMVVPLFEASKDAARLQPLQSWIAQRFAAGSGRRAESEIRDALKKIRRQREDNLQHSFDLVVDLRDERARLRAELLGNRISVRDAAKRYAKLAPIPAMEDIFPTITGVSIAPEGGMGDSAESSVPGAPSNPETRPTDSTAPDADLRELHSKIESDINALEQMIRAAIEQDDGEELRLQRALKALPDFIKAATTAIRSSSTDPAPPQPARAASPSS